MDKRKNWLIGICFSDGEGIYLNRVSGTKEQVKKYLMEKYNEHKDDDSDKFDFGTEAEDNIEEGEDGSLYLYASYEDFHIDYNAVPEMEPIEL